MRFALLISLSANGFTASKAFSPSDRKPLTVTMASNSSKKASNQGNLEQEWNVDLYRNQHSFVWEFGASLIDDLLKPMPGERILDVGCGSGELTKAIVDRGAIGIGIDYDPDMIRAAQEQFSGSGATFAQADAHNFEIEGGPVDAIFSNAALHWVTDAERAVVSMVRALRPGGRFIVEFGARGNIRRIVEATMKAKRDAGIETKLDNPWYFPSIAEYSSLLEKHRIEVTSAALFDRPTPLDGDAGMSKWLTMFGDAMLGDVEDADVKAKIIANVDEQLRPDMWDGERWIADYRRIRIVGQKIS